MAPQPSPLEAKRDRPPQTDSTIAHVSQKIRTRDRDAILQALRTGVVPRRGLQHIQVGRADEVAAIVKDLEGIADGGASIRFAIGEYGSGKTFFLHLLRVVAMEQRFVCMHADLAPDRRLFATKGQARSLYAELARNMATRSKPDGGALSSLVERFIGAAAEEAGAQEVDVEDLISERLSSLQELVGGYDFAQVIAAYWRGHSTENPVLQADAVRWLRGVFSTRTEARNALGVRTIVDDAGVYDQLKLLARFSRLAGYSGLFVCLDEMVNLYKLASTRARTSNYEQILRILNDVLQGGAEGIGFLLCGTPEFLSDTRRGLFSYAALESRLAENRFAGDGLVDLSGPVIRLGNLQPEDLYVLLHKLTQIQFGNEPEDCLLPEEGIRAFMEHCSTRIGDAYFRTPRSTIREFVGLLAVLVQNPETSWEELVGRVHVDVESNPDLEPGDPDLFDDDDNGEAESDTEEEAAAETSGGATGSNSGGASSDDDDLASFKL